MITRSLTHRIDTLAVRQVIADLSPDWLIRSLDERDYGIDILLEFFDNEKPTGKIALIQIKGKEEKFRGTPKLAGFPVRTLLYAEKFSHPFFVFHASISENKVYFIWLQKYIKKLNIDTPKWRIQDSTTLFFPQENVLSENKEKICEIVNRYKLIESGLTYLANFEWLKLHTDFLLNGGLSGAEAALENIHRIKEQRLFIEYFGEVIFDLSLPCIESAIAETIKLGKLTCEAKEVIEEQMSYLSSMKMSFLDQDEMDEFSFECFGFLPY